MFDEKTGRPLASYEWEPKFKKAIEQDYPEMIYDIDNHSLSGSLNGDLVTVIIDSIFLKNAVKFMNIMAQNDTIFVRFCNKSEGDIPKDAPIMTMGQFFEFTGSTYDIDVEQRFKGVGEVPTDLLFRSTMNPALRKLYKITMDDIPEAMRILTILHGDNASHDRKLLIENDKFTLEDIDN